MEISLRQLTYFIALAETRHFGRAAARVHISQPALSVQIRELEDRLGATLINREGRAMSLTPAGQEVLSGARRVRAEIDQLQNAVRWQGGLTGRLKLGVIPTVAPYLLPVALPLLRSQVGGLDLRVREAQTSQLLDDLADGRLDAAIMALPSGQADMIELPLFDDRFLLAGPKAQIATLGARAEALRPATLDPDRLLLLDEGHCLADQALEVCGLARTATRVDLGASSLSTLCGLVAEGFGLTFLPEIAVTSESAAAPGMATLRFADPEPSRTIGLIRRNLPGPDEWFDDLAAYVTQAARSLIDPPSHAISA